MPRPGVTALLLTALLTSGSARPARAQVPASLEGAMSLYAAAAYDDSLAMLDRLPTAGIEPTARVSIDHYRMLCLLALGRTADAEGVIASLLDLHPTYRIAEGDASPRVMKVFAEARRRALPGVIDRRYQDAKRLYTAGDYAAAATGFAVVRTLLGDVELTATDPRLTDLAQVAAGFEELCRAAIAAAERRVAEAAAAADAAATAARAREAELAEAARKAAEPAPIPPPPSEPADGIYSVAHRGVVAPVVIRQDLRRWTGPLPRPEAGTPLGQLEVVIDETGSVIGAAVVTSVSGFYDAVLLDSAKSWKYQPATKDGRPVKFRRVLSILSR